MSGVSSIGKLLARQNGRPAVATAAAVTRASSRRCIGGVISASLSGSARAQSGLPAITGKAAAFAAAASSSSVAAAASATSRLSVSCTERAQSTSTNSPSTASAADATKTTTSSSTAASFSTSAARIGDYDSTGGEQNQRRRHMYHPLYVTGTRYHSGQTSTCLALLSGLQKHFGQDCKLGYMKPIAGEVDATIHPVHPDAALIKELFELDHISYRDISPASDDVMRSFQSIASSSDFVLCEGYTGHAAVGSARASNAELASLLDAKMLFVVNHHNNGIGGDHLSSYHEALDDVEINRMYRQQQQLHHRSAQTGGDDSGIAGVVVNHVSAERHQEAEYYYGEMLQQRYGDDIPLLGCIPDHPVLQYPTLSELERVLDQPVLISGQQYRHKHYSIQKELNLITTSLEVFLKQLYKSQKVCGANHGRTLYVTHASRNDILLGFLMESQQQEKVHQEQGGKATPCHGVWESAMIVTGCDECPISPQVLEIVASIAKVHPESTPPVILCNDSTNSVMEILQSYVHRRANPSAPTLSMSLRDSDRIQRTLRHYEPYIDMDLLVQRVTSDIEETEESVEAQAMFTQQYESSSEYNLDDLIHISVDGTAPGVRSTAASNGIPMAAAVLAGARRSGSATRSGTTTA